MWLRMGWLDWMSLISQMMRCLVTVVVTISMARVRFRRSGFGMVDSAVSMVCESVRCKVMGVVFFMSHAGDQIAWL